MSEVLELGGAEPEVVKPRVTVSEVVGLGSAEPEVVELGVAVSEGRTHDEMELGNDEAARFVYTSSSSSSERGGRGIGRDPVVAAGELGSGGEVNVPLRQGKTGVGEAGTEWLGGWTWRG